MTVTIVVLYLVVILAIGWVCQRRIKTPDDYLVASRKLGIPLCAATLAATHFGGVFSAGGAQAGFDSGLSAAWYGIACGVGLVILGFLTASRFRQLSLYTLPEYLERRYGSRGARIVGAGLSAAALIGITASQIQVAGAAAGILGLDSRTASILATAIFVGYTVMGGLWAVAVTDFVQILIGAIGMAAACVIVLGRTSGFGGLSASLSDKFAAGTLESHYTHLLGDGFGFLLWLSLPTVMYTLIGQDFYQRLFAARSPQIAKSAALIAGFTLIPLSFLPVMIGMGARALEIPVNNASATTVLFDVITHVMPGLLGGVVLAAFLAAIMSSADSLLAAAASHIVKDLWIRPRTPDKELSLSRWVTAAAGFLALLIALGSEEIFDTILSSYILYTAGVFVCVLGGVLWKGATRAGALTSMALGSLVALYGIVTDAELGGVPLEVLAAGVSAVSFVGVSLVRRS